MEKSALNRDALLQDVAAAGSPEALEQVRVRLLGRNGVVTGAMRGLGGLPPEERRDAGAKLNLLRDEVAAALEAAGERLRRAALSKRLAGERADVTLPVSLGAPGGAEPGRLHPTTQTIDQDSPV